MPNSKSRLRRIAAKHGYRFTKTNWRRDSIDNFVGYQIIDIDINGVADGVRYDLMSLDDVADSLKRLGVPV